jgi:hypothetical protein
MNLGGLQIRDKEEGAAANRAATDEGGGGGFGKIEKAALSKSSDGGPGASKPSSDGGPGASKQSSDGGPGASKQSSDGGPGASKQSSDIDNLVESERGGAAEDEYRPDVEPDLERLMGFSGFKTNKKVSSAATDKKAQQFDVEVSFYISCVIRCISVLVFFKTVFRIQVI